MSNNGPHYLPGRYKGEITDQGLSKAGTGTVQIVLKFRVLEGTQPKQEEVEQYERTLYLSVTEKTMPYLLPKLEALGYTRDSFKFLDLNASQCHDLRGVVAEFFCQHESRNDGQGLREKWDVASNRQSEPLELKPPDAKDIRNLDALFGKARKEAGLVSKPRPVAVPAGSHDPHEITDDDLPF